MLVAAAIRAELLRVADPSKAAPMAKYMKHVQPFMGVQSGPLRAAVSSALDATVGDGKVRLVRCVWCFSPGRAYSSDGGADSK